MDDKTEDSTKVQAKLMEKIQDAIATEDWRAADLMIHEYLARYPHDPHALMYLGVSRAAQGFEPEGEHHLLASLTLNPRNKEAYYHLGLIVMNQGRCIIASESFKKALTFDPTDHVLLFNYGRALERLNMSYEAIEAYRKAIEYHPEPPDSEFISEVEDALKRIEAGMPQDAEDCSE